MFPNSTLFDKQAHDDELRKHGALNNPARTPGKAEGSLDSTEPDSASARQKGWAAHSQGGEPKKTPGRAEG